MTAFGTHPIPPREIFDRGAATFDVSCRQMRRQCAHQYRRTRTNSCRRPMPERLMRERRRRRVPGHTLGATLPAPRVVVNDAALQHHPIRLEQLPDHFEAELVETAERGQVRRSEGSVVHVEVFRRMGSIETSILGDLDAYPRTSRRPSATPSTAKNRKRHA